MRLSAIDLVTNKLVELYPQGLLKTVLDSYIDKATSGTEISNLTFPDGTPLALLVIGAEKTTSTIPIPPQPTDPSETDDDIQC